MFEFAVNNFFRKICSLRFLFVIALCEYKDEIRFNIRMAKTKKKTVLFPPAKRLVTFIRYK